MKSATKKIFRLAIWAAALGIIAIAACYIAVSVNAWGRSYDDASLIPHARFMFNMVFFITILSLLIQGTTVNRMAQWLGLKDEYREKEFKVNLPDEINAAINEMNVSAQLLNNGDLLKDVKLPPNTLVIMIKRDNEYLVPTGNTRLYLNDTLLLIAEEEQHLQELISRHS